MIAVTIVHNYARFYGINIVSNFLTEFLFLPNVGSAKYVLTLNI